MALEGQMTEERTAKRDIRYVVEGTSVRISEAEVPKRSAPEDEEEKIRQIPDAVRVERARSRKETPDAVRGERTRGRKETLGAAYVAFIALMCAAAVLVCVRFLWLKKIVTDQRNRIAVQETLLTKLRSENDALLESLVNAQDWEAIRDAAMGRLGMKYPGQNQVERYSTDGDGYVRQYRDVP